MEYLCDFYIAFKQSYVIKSAPWTILWLRILGIFSVEYIKRLCVFMFQTCSNSQLLRRVLWISAEQAIGASLKHKNTQPLYMFNRVRVPHLNSLKERTWLHSFGPITPNKSVMFLPVCKASFCYQSWVEPHNVHSSEDVPLMIYVCIQLVCTLGLTLWNLSCLEFKFNDTTHRLELLE